VLHSNDPFHAGFFHCMKNVTDMEGHIRCFLLMLECEEHLTKGRHMLSEVVVKRIFYDLVYALNLECALTLLTF
jgi:hypothetical protein